MHIGSTFVEETFAEAFGMSYVRLVVTAADEHWLEAAVREVTGYSSSVIACDAETAVERRLGTTETPDGRLGAAILVFGFSADALAKVVPNRVGQCVMTCPSTAVFDGFPESAKRVPLGKHIRFFGDGFQKSKLIAGKRFWRIPVMDGEFLVQESLGVGKGVGGGNVILQSVDQTTGLAAARRGVESIADMAGVITPFPGGVARSGSKVGSRYKTLKASTSDPFCPTLRGRVTSKLHPEANCAYEIVIDGVDESSVGAAMKQVLHAVAGEGVVAIGAGNYGGKLGKYHYHLRTML
ncbi:MAG: formylmethanofuran--tetrahydromethanopterin N-formyltransferase [Pirellulales bacterium]